MSDSSNTMPSPAPPASPLSASILSSPATLSLHSRSLGYRFSTLCATVDNPDSDHKDQHGSSSVPIYQTATFKGMNGVYDYSRSGNPSRTFLEHHIAKISFANHAFAVTSGMGALDIICRTLKLGDEIIAGNDLYGGSNRLLTYLKQHSGIMVHHVDTTNLECIRPLLVKGSPIRMVLLESPTNPLLQIVDIEQIAHQVKQVIPEAIVVVDNTMMSPYLMRPLEFGADIVYDSGTKYLSGHHDLMAGLVTCNSDRIAQQLGFMINSVGNGLAPFDCFLLLRGIKTLAVRMDRQQATALRVAKYLDRLGFKVNYPGLNSHKGKDVHDRLAKGPGAVLSFETGDKQLSEKIVSSTRLWGISVSFGCVNSLISMPCLMSHASIDPSVRAARNLPEDLIRLCVGIEDGDDLLDDLESALIQSGAIRLVDEATVGGLFERVIDRSASPRSGNETVTLEVINSPGPVQAAKETRQIHSSPAQLLVSAPGKIILFGEHAVVFGKRAIAAAVDLRCYCLVEPAGLDETVTLVLPDSDFSASWRLGDLPWDLVGEPEVKEELAVDRELSRLIHGLACDLSDKNGLIQASHAFLYLFVKLAKQPSRRSQVFTVRSALPIGAGLGSSASYSVCLASSLLYSHSHLAPPTAGKMGREDVAEINRWAFLGEKLLHGNPSGVDNTVSSFGGALCFQKRVEVGEDERKLKEQIEGFEAMQILISDTKVSRDTKALVASLAKRKAEEPDYVQNVLEEIEKNTLQARELLKRQDKLSTVEWSRTMGELIEFNHVRLVSLGVSHPMLELVRTIGNQFGLSSKLTGAGGGGCAVTYIPSGFDVKEVERLRAEIESRGGMKTYQTSVGVPGIAILVHQNQQELSNDAEGYKKVKENFLRSGIDALHCEMMRIHERLPHHKWLMSQV